MADHSEKVKDIIEKELGVEREKLTSEASFAPHFSPGGSLIVPVLATFD